MLTFHTLYRHLWQADDHHLRKAHDAPACPPRRPQNLGSGLVCGITVRSGVFVDAFGLLFYNRIANAEVLDMQQDYTPQPLVKSENSAIVTCPMPGANVSAVRSLSRCGCACSLSTRLALGAAEA